MDPYAPLLALFFGIFFFVGGLAGICAYLNVSRLESTFYLILGAALTTLGLLGLRGFVSAVGLWAWMTLLGGLSVMVSGVLKYRVAPWHAANKQRLFNVLGGALCWRAC